MKENLKEKGSISLFVLITCLFFTVILGGVYIASMNKLHVQEQSVSQIQENYTRNVAAAGEYASGMTTMSKEKILEIVKEYIETNTDYVSKTEILDKTYPIGSIYISTSSTNPGNLFGGTWEEIKDRFLLAGGGTYTTGSTGGAASVSYTPAGTVAGHQLTVSEIPSHTHTFSGTTSTYSKSYCTNPLNYSTYFGGYESNITTSLKGMDDKARGSVSSTDSWNTLSWNINHSHTFSGTTSSIGSNGSHSHGWTGTTATINTMPPYLAVYMWKRVS